MEDKFDVALTILSRSREISEDRWVEIKGELDDVKGKPLAETCPPNAMNESYGQEPGAPIHQR